MPYAFDFAVSFSGECRSQAKKLSELLVERGARVFYDNFYLEHLLGKRLDEEFSSIFGKATRYFVPLVSSSYAMKAWPQYEWSVARLEAERRDQEFILPLRVDDTRLMGLPDTVCYLDLRNMEMEKVANILYDKLERFKRPIDIDHETQEWVVTFGLMIEGLEEEGALPSDAPSEVPALCEWLIEELVVRLRGVSLSRMRVVEDSRAGETLSVRLSFLWEPTGGPLDFGDLGYWDLLELAPFDDIYGDNNGG